MPPHAGAAETERPSAGDPGEDPEADAAHDVERQVDPGVHAADRDGPRDRDRHDGPGGRAVPARAPRRARTPPPSGPTRIRARSPAPGRAPARARRPVGPVRPCASPPWRPSTRPGSASSADAVRRGRRVTPAVAPTTSSDPTKLPSCIGAHTTGHSGSGRPFSAEKTRTSASGTSSVVMTTAQLPASNAAPPIAATASPVRARRRPIADPTRGDATGARPWSSEELP